MSGREASGLCRGLSQIPGESGYEALISSPR